MGGWVALVGKVPDLQQRLKRFRSTFSVTGVPTLHISCHENNPGLKVILWAWNRNSYPDLAYREEKGKCLLLCGAVTGVGNDRPIPEKLDETAAELLDRWADKGGEIIPWINGSFSALFHDGDSEETIIFTDRFASRSVWLAEEEDVRLSGNFSTALASFMSVPIKLNPAGLWSFFHIQRNAGCRGLYSGFRAMMAGEKVSIKPGKETEVSRWVERRYSPDTTLSASDWGRSIAGALRTSSERYIKVSNQLHLFLSGGLDSRITAASFRNPLRTITLFTSPNAESRLASLTSKILKLEHQPMMRSPHWNLEIMDAAALVSGGNYLNSHAHFMIPVQRRVGNEPEAEFLLGDLLENFNKHYFSLPEGAHWEFYPAGVADLLSKAVPYAIKDKSRTGLYFNEGIREQMSNKYHQEMAGYAATLSGVSDDPADCLDTLLRWGRVSITPTFNMISSIWPLAGERNIRFDNDLDDLSLNIPASLRGKGILHNRILFELSVPLALLPDANTFLPPLSPPFLKASTKVARPLMGRMRRAVLLRRRKTPVLTTSGSWLLTHELYRNDLEYRQRVEGIIRDESLFPSEIFDRRSIDKALEEYLNGNIGLHPEIETLLSFGTLQRLIPASDLDLQ